LYHSEYKKIEDFVTCNSGTKTEAQDVFQDGVMVLLEKIKTPGLILHAELEHIYTLVAKIFG